MIEQWVWQVLRDADVSMVPLSAADRGADAVLTWSGVDGRAHTVEVEVKVWADFRPSMVSKLPSLRRAAGAHLLVIAESMSQQSATRLKTAGHSWLTRRLGRRRGAAGELHVGGHWVKLGSEHPPSVPARRGRPPRDRARVVQTLLEAGSATQRGLADNVQVSQALVSTTLTHLQDQGLVTTGLGRPVCWRITDWDALVDHWLDLFPGVRGIPSYWYSLAPVKEQAARALDALGKRSTMTGLVAADEIAPWAVPATAHVYARHGVDLHASGFVPSLPHEATLVVTVTDDAVVHPGVEAVRWVRRMGPSVAPERLAPPLIILWDLTRSADLDADKAADRLRGRLRQTRPDGMA